jgi:hypothetical protein
MISITNRAKTLQGWNAVVTIDRASAISNGFGDHPAVFKNNDPYYLWEGTVYTPGGEFDSNTAVIYKDTYGSPLTRCDVDCYILCNQFTMTIASKSHPYFMTINPGSNNIFNQTVKSINDYRLQYATPCWLSRSDISGPYEPTVPTNNVWKCTYITAFHDGASILNSTNISINKYGGLTCRYNNSVLYNGTGTGDKQWWLTEVEEQANGTHIGHAVNLDVVSFSIYTQCNPWIINIPKDDLIRGYSMPQYTYASTYLRPKHEISVHPGGNGTSPFYAIPTPVVTYHFQDVVRTVGHFGFSDNKDNLGNATPHPHEGHGGSFGSSYYIPSASKLITCAPLYVSSTPNATGGTSDRTIQASGWYQHSSKNVANDPWFWWDQSTYTWTKST